jgi:hypothetical protein
MLRRLAMFLRLRRATEDFHEEVRFHLDRLEQRYRDAGLEANDAAAQARQQFGSPIAFTEQAQDVWLGRWLVDARQDLRYAARMLTRQPAFAGIAIGTLAIGIAANTAMFSVVRAVMLQPLPYRDPSRLVVIWDRDAKRKGAARLFAQYRDLEHWRAHSRTLEQVAGVTWAVPSPIMTGMDRRAAARRPGNTSCSRCLASRRSSARIDWNDVCAGCSIVLAYRFPHDVVRRRISPASFWAATIARGRRRDAARVRVFPEPTEMWVLITPPIRSCVA